MKLRIDPEKISYRIDLDELELLLKQGTLQEITPLPEASLTYKIICLPAGSSPDFQARDGEYILSLSKDVMEDHKAALPSLKGIINEFDDSVIVALEINLKKKIKHSLE